MPTLHQVHTAEERRRELQLMLHAVRICARCARSLTMDAFTPERPYACRECQAAEAERDRNERRRVPRLTSAPLYPPAQPARRAFRNGRPPRTALGRLRVGAGLSQEALARRIGVDASIVGLWELGRRAVPWTRREALAAGLGVTVDELAQALSGPEIPPAPTPPQPMPLSRTLPLMQVYGVRREELPAQVAERLQRQAERLVDAAMTPERVPVQRMYLHCLLCGRGAGVGGVVMFRTSAPRACDVKPCRWCGGKMLLDELCSFQREFDQTHPVRLGTLLGRVA